MFPNQVIDLVVNVAQVAKLSGKSFEITWVTTVDRGT